MSYWYLATPYTNYPHGHDAAHEHACQIAGQFIRAGVNVFCPIAHSHHLAQIGGLDHMDGELWKRLDAPYLENARGVIVAMMDGWRASEGVTHETARARQLGLPCLAAEVTGPNPMPHTPEDFRVRVRESIIRMILDVDLIDRVRELDGAPIGEGLSGTEERGAAREVGRQFSAAVADEVYKILLERGDLK